MPLVRNAIRNSIAALALLGACLWAMPPVHGSEAPAATPQDSAEVTGAVSDEPVPVPEPSAKTLRYYHSGNLLCIAETLWGLVVPAAILLTGLSARLRDWAVAIGRRWLLVIAVYAVLYVVVAYLLSLPLSYYRGFVRLHEYGLSNQSLGQWFGDSLKALAVTAVVAAATLWVPYLLLRKAPRRWWLYASVAAVPFLTLMLLVQPVVIAPLFDDFGPMQDKALEAKILNLADRVGIEEGRVLEVNKSEDTQTVNAYVGGLFGTQRIVLWDTLLDKLEEDQVLAVMGHEMGHYVLGHVWKLLALLCVLVLAISFAVHLSLRFIIPRLSRRFGVSYASDVASFPLLALLFSLFFLAVQPIALAYSREMEREADRFALELTRDNRAQASALATLEVQNLAHPRPGPLYVLWRSRHPPIAERIELANRYRPWETGQPMAYAHYFGGP